MTQPAALRKPVYTLPPGACDTHCHVFGPAAKFPYAPGRRYTPADVPKETLAALHAHLGIARVVIVQTSAHGVDNSAMLDAIADAPQHMRGVALVDDSFKDKELEVLHEGGVRGARFNFVGHLGGRPEPDVFHRIVDRIRGLGWHVVLHMDASEIVPLSDIIRRLPLPFVIDHMGRVPSAGGLDQPPFKTLLDLARLDTCWIKVSGAERISMPPYSDALPFARAIVEAIPDRVLWGTDFPHPNLNHETDEADLVDLIPQYTQDDVSRRKLLVDNPARLYGFS